MITETKEPIDLAKEPIRVAAVFGPGRKIQPAWLHWRGKKFTFTKIMNYLELRNGEHEFTMTDGANYFRLIFKDYKWTLTSVHFE